ncbi:hypothetical protein ACKC5O_17445 [Aeromonas schubertii]|uniref:hypothetical protein n=1 Tax=Aeromonas schubertii TaxID=652 RepID=UPI0038B60B53
MVRGWLLMLLTTGALAAPRVEVLAGLSGWTLHIEQEGIAQPDALDVTPLLRHFVVGRITQARLSTPRHELTRWTIPLSLKPHHQGALPPVPPLRIGDEQSASLTLPPLDQAAARPLQDLFIEQQASLEGDGRYWVGQPFVYRLTLWLPEEVQSPGLEEPQADGFRVRRLGEDSWTPPATPGGPGRLERRWLLQARKSGASWLEAPRFTATLPLPGGGGVLPLSGRANPVRLLVSDPPQPAARLLRLSQSLQTPTPLRVGEPLVRTLLLEWEDGELGHLPLPLPELAGLKSQPDGEQFRERYLERGHLLGQRTVRQAITPEHAGEFTLPPVELRWFNTLTEREELARLPPLHLKVLPARAPVTTSAPTQLDLLLLLMLIPLLRRRLPPLLHALYLGATLRGEPDALRQRWCDWLRRSGYPRHALPPGLRDATSRLEHACFGGPRSGSAQQFRRALWRHWRWLLAPTPSHNKEEP